jgi:hypothetical protein
VAETVAEPGQEVGQDVELEGELGAVGDHAVFVDAVLLAGSTPEMRLRDARGATLALADHTEIELTFARDARGGPEREIRGLWRDIKQHPAKPIANRAPDDDVTLRGVWIVPGDRVWLLGRITALAFVPDTGGEREAPARRIARVEVSAIGLDELSARAAAAPPRRRSRYATPAAIAAVVAGLAALALLGLAAISR